MTTRIKRVLHITESFGGGVTSAINSYILSSSQHKHFIFASVRTNDATGEESIGAASGIRLVPRRLSSILELKRFIAEVAPDVIHIHSTYAGVLGRLLPFVPPAKTIYTPHGFAFLRQDHPAALALYRFIEKLLARRTAVIAGCGLDEKNIASAVLGHPATCELINVCNELPVVDSIRSQTDKPVVGMVGRVSAQKGYDFFAELAASCGDIAHFKWIGGGGADAVEVLQQAGVEVTGWITRPHVIAHMQGLDVYFHSAAWDGFPISVLEAARLDLPVMLRRIGPFVAEDLATFASPAEAAQEIRSWLAGSPFALERARNNASRIQSHHSVGNLQRVLDQLYARF
jgi:glycosyltransferase involved in cell wall biosynthesis